MTKAQTALPWFCIKEACHHNLQPILCNHSLLAWWRAFLSGALSVPSMLGCLDHY